MGIHHESQLQLSHHESQSTFFHCIILTGLVDEDEDPDVFWAEKVGQIWIDLKMGATELIVFEAVLTDHHTKGCGDNVMIQTKVFAMFLAEDATQFFTTS